jgi:hypothetical protein
MADLRFEDKNNQKKTLSVFASGIIATSATMDETLFTLPEASLVLSAKAIVITPSGAVTNTVDILVGSTVIGNEVVVGVAGLQEGTPAPAYFATGGSVTVVAGADAPSDIGRIKIVVEYIETELTSGTYTD